MTRVSADVALARIVVVGLAVEGLQRELVGLGTRWLVRPSPLASAPLAHLLAVGLED